MPLQISVRAAHSAQDLLCVLRDLLDLMPRAQFDGGQCLDLRAEQLIEVRLVEHGVRDPALSAEIAGGNVEENLTGLVLHAVVDHGLAQLGHGLPESDGLERAQDFSVEVHRTRLRPHLGVLFEAHR